MEIEMKIGPFARRNQTSIDTVRHYISLGLLMPEKINTQYVFDEECTRDFEEVLQLKAIGFSLSEIQQLILYRRIGRLTEYHRRLTYRSFFKRKMALIESEIQKLKAMGIKLSEVLDKMEAGDRAAIKDPEGLPLDALELFACPDCHGSLEIAQGRIEGGMLTDGTLACSCGYKLHLVDGIVMTPDLKHTYEAVKSTDLDRTSEEYIDAYINTTHMAYLKRLYAGLEWSRRWISKIPLEGATVLELGSGYGYFLRHTLDRFPRSATYIAVDHDPVKILWLKKTIESSRPDCRVIFLCADFLNLPLKAGGVDLLLDISGSSNYALEHPEFLLHETDPLLKDGAHLMGHYILFDNFSASSRIPVTLRGGFRINSIRSHLKTLQFDRLDDLITEAVDQGGPLEDYFVEGERVRAYLFSGVKQIKPSG